MWQFVILGGVRFMEASILHGSFVRGILWSFQKCYYTSQPRAASGNATDAKPHQNAHLKFVISFQFSFVELIEFDYYWGTGSILAFAPNWKHTTGVFANRCWRKVHGGLTRHAYSTFSAHYSYDSKRRLPRALVCAKLALNPVRPSALL